MGENLIFDDADDWQALHDLPDGAVLIDDTGHAYQVNRPRDRHGVERWPGEIWVNPVSDEYAFIVRREASKLEPRVGSYKPEGKLTLVWQPPA